MKTEFYTTRKQSYQHGHTDWARLDDQAFPELGGKNQGRRKSIS